MASHETPELLGNGEGYHEVEKWEKQMPLGFEPYLGLIVLAFGTVPVFTGMIAVVELLTGVTEVDLTAKRFGSALFYRLHGLEVAWKHSSSELFPVVGSMNAEDIGYLHHLKDPP